ncbi:MAG TPA: hypothetical protein VMM56_07005 [Planctomycetaceae bacterium]|nr:hypothetical protein [Planctomycetaceae bacterium]
MPHEPMEMSDFDCDEVLSFWQNMPGVGLSDGDTPSDLTFKMTL